MPCTTPLAGWYATEANPLTGKHPVTFKFSEADTSRPISVPCRQCLACRINRAHEWAVRLMHERKAHRPESVWFATLTYDEANLPRTPEGLPTLRPVDWVNFMKRLRRGIDEESGERIRFYQSGEYGELTSRPHHHAIFYNLVLSDLEPLDTHTEARARLLRSTQLEDAWGHGRVVLGDVTFESASYVASYVTKKFTNKDPDLVRAHYQGRVPEYATMSRRPGIGATFLKAHASDIYPADEVAIYGKTYTMRPPAYYDRRMDKLDQELLDETIQKRKCRINRFRNHRELEALGAKLATKTRLYRRKEPGK